MTQTKLQSCWHFYPKSHSTRRSSRLYELIIGLCLVSSIVSQNQNESSPTATVPIQKTNEKLTTVVNTCCDLDLTKEHTQCSKPSPGDEITPSKIINIPYHLVAENVTTEFTWVTVTLLNGYLISVFIQVTISLFEINWSQTNIDKSCSWNQCMHFTICLTQIKDNEKQMSAFKVEDYLPELETWKFRKSEI